MTVKTCMQKRVIGENRSAGRKPVQSNNTEVPHTANTTLESILLDTPSCSEHRVSFDFNTKIKELKKEIKPEYEVKDRTLVVSGRLTGVARRKAKKCTAFILSPTGATLKYRSKEDLDVDLRAMGLKAKTYMEDKLIVQNLPFRATEESVAEFFGAFGEVEKTQLEKNAKGHCTGKGVITFAGAFRPGKTDGLYSLRLGGRLLRIERIKKQRVNRTRLFVSHMKKKLKIADIRRVLKEKGFVPKSVKIDLNDGRNRGYGFIEFASEAQAERFRDEYEGLRGELGTESYVEYSQEKK